MLAAACGRGADGSPAEEAAALGLQNVAEPVPGLITAAQPTPAQVGQLREMGYDRFISLRLTDEPGAGWEEVGIPETGASFRRIPVAGPDDLTLANVEALAAMLEADDAEGTVLYCASSNRVGAMLALKAFWLDGESAEEALALGRGAGMRSLEPEVRRIMEESGS
jgi:protein tyrosine phosphatase (PTP) superfamily phosphohydrolase (DUF442 family)